MLRFSTRARVICAALVGLFLAPAAPAQEDAATPTFSNRIFNFNIERRHDGAIITWQSRFPGVEDTLRYRAVGESEWQVALSPLVQTGELLRGLIVLRAAEVDPATAEDDTILAALLAGGVTPVNLSGSSAKLAIGVPNIDVPDVDDLDDVLDEIVVDEDAFVQALRDLALAASVQHIIALTGLEAGASYEYEASSVSIDGRFAALSAGTFRTRATPDLRQAIGLDLDVQATPTTMTANWFTNRAADTRIVVGLPGESGVESVVDNLGSFSHVASVVDLLPNTEYEFTAISKLVGVEALLSEGLLNEAATTVSKTATFRTLAANLPLRFLGPPTRIIGSESVMVNFTLNQIAETILDYGLIENSVAKVTSETQVTDSELYKWRVQSQDVLNNHTVVVAALKPSTTYRYRMTVVTASGDTLTTDPRGNEQWSRDLKFTTSAAGDTLPPVIVEGPTVVARDVLAVVRFTTDIETVAQVVFGTRGGTYNTADEFEYVDQTPDGRPRFARDHSVTIAGLEAGTDYQYRIEVAAANGKTAAFEPGVSSAKSFGLLQPPGGSGSFVTDIQADTQFPVILDGPTVTSKTHDTAVIEWSTDEPASSEVRFGSEARDQQTRSGENEFNHKLVLSNLQAGTTYSYLVASTDASGNGATESSTAAFTTDPELDLKPPSVISGPAVLYKNDQSATVQWSTDEVAKGVVHFGTTEELGFVRELPGTERTHSIALTNLQAGTQYFYKVFSTDLSNNGPVESAVLNFTTDGAADLDPPVLFDGDGDGQPDIAVVPSDSSALITWSTDELSDSFVEFGTSPDLLDLRTGDVKDVTAHQLTLTNLTPDTTYYYRVGSIDRANNPATESEVFSFATLASADSTAPAQPANVRGTVGSNMVILNWDANAEVDLAGYNVYRRTGEEEFAAVVTRLGETNYTDVGLVNGTTYEYVVTAIDREKVPNESAFGQALALVPTLSSAPSAPTGLETLGNGLQPTLEFLNAIPVNEGAALTYTIQISTQEDFGNVATSVAGLEQNASSVRTNWVSDRVLDEGVTYYWRVRTVEGPLASPFSSTQQWVANNQTMALVGDLDGSADVGFQDFFVFADAFGGNPSTANWNPNADLDGDNQIGFQDFFIFADNFGRTSVYAVVSGGKRLADVQAVDADAVVKLEALGGTRDEDQLVKLRVHAENMAQVDGFGLVLRYDPKAVQFIRADKGPGHLLDSQGGTAPLFGVLGQYPGLIVLGNALTQGTPVSGAGLLAELEFRLSGEVHAAHFDVRDAVVRRGDGAVARIAQVRATRLLPQAYFLGANYPNPFNPSTTIEYALPQAGPVRLRIYDVLGQKVRDLVRDEMREAGFYRAVWDGRNTAGQAVSSGMYFYRLEAGGGVQTRKMALIK